MSPLSGPLQQFVSAYPDSRFIELLIPDLAGILRGKRIAPAEYEQIFVDGFTLPGATVLLDAMGSVISDLGYGDVDGDPDVYARVIPATLAPVTWSEQPCGQALFAFHNVDGSPYFADSRHVLTRAAQPLRDMGLTIVMAIELEFYLLDASGDSPLPGLPRIFGTRQSQSGNQTYHPDDLWQVDAFLEELQTCCSAQRLPISTTVAEYGPAQYEINLHHVADPVQACDHALLLKRAVKAIALRHGFVACFMAKPFAEEAGSGMHVHVSLVDDQGNNFFSGGEQKLAVPPYSDTLRAAVGGLVETMAEGMAVFAPNANSYRRLRPDFFAPVMPNWGTNHRSVSIRIPMAGSDNTRIEHRTSGADANPYLVAAMILLGIHHGLQTHADPGIHVNATDEIDLEAVLPIRWEAALDAFASSALIPHYMGKEFHRVYALARRGESRRFYNQVTERDFQWYLRSV